MGHPGTALRSVSERGLPENTLRDPSSRPSGAAVRAVELRGRRCSVCGEELPRSYRVCPHDGAPLGVSPEIEDPLIGHILAGSYRVTRRIGRGGMGRLYEAEHARLGRLFAAKVLHESHALSKDAVARFEREARALSRIRSDYVIDIVDLVRVPDGRMAIVTTLLEGEDLKARLDRAGQIPSTEAIALARQLCRGLAAAHAGGVIHRDLKPSNLFLCSTPEGSTGLKILDFGVAKLSGDAELTRAGAVVGTPAYMAPEQAKSSHEASEAADLYAVGAVLYHMLSGRPPIEARDPTSALTKALSESPPPLRERCPELADDLVALVEMCMARDPKERPASALELEEALASLKDAGEDAREQGDLGAHALGALTGAPEEALKGIERGTLVLPRGSVHEAQRLARRAQRALPLAVLGSASAGLFAGAVGAMASAAVLGPSPAWRATSAATFLALAVGGLLGRAFRRRLRRSPLSALALFDRVRTAIGGGLRGVGLVLGIGLSASLLGRANAELGELTLGLAALAGLASALLALRLFGADQTDASALKRQTKKPRRRTRRA